MTSDVTSTAPAPDVLTKGILATAVPVTAKAADAVTACIVAGCAAVPVTEMLPLAGCDCRMLVEVPVDVEPSVPRT